MELPVINTWEKNNDIIDTANSTIAGQLSGQSVKSMMGWGGVMIWDKNIDPVDMLHAYLKCVASESCGECTPCRLGSVRLVDIMEKIINGNGRKADLDQIRFIVKHIRKTAIRLSVQFALS